MSDNNNSKNIVLRGLILIALTVLIPIPSFAKDYSFSWAANDGQVDGYKLYYKRGGSAAPPFDGYDAYEGESPIYIFDRTSFTLTGLEDNTTYHFTLTAYSGADESDFTDIITVFPGDDLQERVEGVQTINNKLFAIDGFDKRFYLAAKLASLQANYSGWIGKTTADVELVLESHGFTAESHYSQYGYLEGLSPNQYFNHAEYIRAKATDLHHSGGYASVEEAQAAFNSAWPYDAYQHYILHGAAEGINPSNSFDESQYLTDKLSALQASDPEWYGATIDELREALLLLYGMTPLGHFLLHGWSEGLRATPVPDNERVEF